MTRTDGRVRMEAVMVAGGETMLEDPQCSHHGKDQQMRTRTWMRAIEDKHDQSQGHLREHEISDRSPKAFSSGIIPKRAPRMGQEANTMGTITTTRPHMVIKMAGI